jgi:hypothetical protein
MRLARQKREVAAITGRYERPKIARSRLIASARAAKAYDAYHSTTLKEYCISPEAVDAIVKGESSPDGPEDKATLRAAVAPVARALLVHLEFVTVHPFIDGNCRLGRLLMNYKLGSPGRLYRRTSECRSSSPSSWRRWRVTQGRSSGICGI